jgi:hypothetical protein
MHTCTCFLLITWHIIYVALRRSDKTESESGICGRVHSGEYEDYSSELAGNLNIQMAKIFISLLIDSKLISRFLVMYSIFYFWCI